MEVDMYPPADPGRADYIDGAIGDGSWCEYTNGYFAHGVGPTTAKALAGLIDRLVRVDVDPAVPGRNLLRTAWSATAWCLRSSFGARHRDFETPEAAPPRRKTLQPPIWKLKRLTDSFQIPQVGRLRPLNPDVCTAARALVYSDTCEPYASGHVYSRGVS